MSPRSRGRTPAAAGTKWLFAAATAFLAVAVWRVLQGDELGAGVACALAGSALVWAGARARRGTVLLRVADSALDRLFDGAVLGAIAWETRASSPATCAAALVAMSAGFLGSYVRARGTSLGYGVEESPKTRGLRYALVSAGLLTGWVGPALWAAAGVSILAALVRSSQVAKEERV
jgi:hypothetical protein